MVPRARWPYASWPGLRPTVIQLDVGTRRTAPARPVRRVNHPDPRDVADVRQLARPPWHYLRRLRAPRPQPLPAAASPRRSPGSALLLEGLRCDGGFIPEWGERSVEPSPLMSAIRCWGRMWSDVLPDVPVAGCGHIGIKRHRCAAPWRARHRAMRRGARPAWAHRYRNAGTDRPAHSRRGRCCARGPRTPGWTPPPGRGCHLAEVQAWSSPRLRPGASRAGQAREGGPAVTG